MHGIKIHRKLRMNSLPKKTVAIFHCVCSMGTLPDSITQQPPVVFFASARQAENPRNDFALTLVPRKLREVFHPCLAQSGVLRDVFVNSFALLSVSCRLSLLWRFLLAALSVLKLLTTVQLNHCEQNSSQCTRLEKTQTSSDALSSKTVCK